MKRVRTPRGARWTVYIDSGVPRLTWRPSWIRLPSGQNSGAEEKRLSPLGSVLDAAANDESGWAITVTTIVTLAGAALYGLGIILGLALVPVLHLVERILLTAGEVVYFGRRRGARSGWTVVAENRAGDVRHWRAASWRTARRTVKLIADALVSGDPGAIPNETEFQVQSRD